MRFTQSLHCKNNHLLTVIAQQDFSSRYYSISTVHSILSIGGKMFPIPSMIGKASQLSTSSQMMSQASTSTGVTMLHPSAPPSPRVGLLPGKLRRSSSSSGAGKGSRYSPYPSPGSNRHFVPSVPLTTRSALLSSQCYGTPLYHEYNAQRFNLEKARYHDLCNDPSSAISVERKYDVIHANLLDDLEK